MKTTSESTNVYITLTGEAIDLDVLDMTRRSLALKIIAAKDGHTASDYSREARRLIVEDRSYLTTSHLFNGPIGAIYRDGFYRLTAPNESEERKVFVNRFRYHPARLLLDRFLDGWITQGQFALDSGLAAGIVTRLFQSVLEGVSCELSVERLHVVFERLMISPKIHHPDHYDNLVFENLLGKKPFPISTRELGVMKMIAEATRISSADERRDFFRQEVARIYHLDDLHVIEDFVSYISNLTT